MPTLDDFKTLFETIRKQTGLEMLVPDADGLVSIRVDDEYNINLQFIEEAAKILCFVEVASLPENAGVAVYRDLLTGSLFGKDTGGGYFTMEGESNTVIYNYMFDFATAADDPENFVETLENILQLVNIWADRINGNLDDEASDKQDDDVKAPYTQPSTFVFRP